MEWNAISSYFEAGHLERLVRHQVESYNEFVTKQMEATIHMFNPVNVHSEQFYN
jgi:DNA-directed RNA polymerase beta subunit